MRRSILAVAAVFLAAYLGAALALFGPQSNLDDDRVYLYATNFTLSAPAQYSAESGGWRERLQAAGYHPESLARYDFRAQYATNYVAQAAAIAVVRALRPWAGGDDYPGWLRSTLVASGLILVLFGLAVTFSMLVRLPPEDRTRGLLGFVALAALTFLPALTYNQISRSMDLLYPLRALFVLVQPGFELAPFGIQNRNVATLLLVAAVFARWRGATAAVYWIVFAAATLHATYGALILLLMLGLDAALQPAALRRAAVLVPIAATAVWSAFFGLAFGEFTAPWMAPALFFGAIAVLLAASLMPLDRVAPVRWLRGLPPRQGEVVLLAAALLLQLTAVAAAALSTEGLERDYIVNTLSGRPLGLLRIPLFLGVAAIVTPALPEKWVRRAFVAAALGSLASLPVGALVMKMRYKPTPTEAEVLAHLPSGPANGSLAPSETERAIYYSIAQAIDSGRPRP